MPDQTRSERFEDFNHVEGHSTHDRSVCRKSRAAVGTRNAPARIGSDARQVTFCAACNIPMAAMTNEAAAAEVPNVELALMAADARRRTDRSGCHRAARCGRVSSWEQMRRVRKRACNGLVRRRQTIRALRRARQCP